MKISIHHGTARQPAPRAPLVRALARRAFSGHQVAVAAMQVMISQESTHVASRHAVRCSIQVRVIPSGSVHAEATDFTDMLAAYHALGKAKALLVHRLEQRGPQPADGRQDRTAEKTSCSRQQRQNRIGGGERTQKHRGAAAHGDRGWKK